MKAVILAAGKSSRFQPISDNRHKGLTEVLGKPLISHTIESLRDSGVEEIIVVQNPKREIEDKIDSVDHFVLQEEPNGMGDALRQAEHLLEDDFLVLTPYRANASKFFESMIAKSKEEDSDIVFLSNPTEQPEKYGILELEDGKATNIVEKPDSDNAPSNMKAVGMYLLNTSFFDYLEDVEKWEYQFEDALSNQMKERPASVLELSEDTNSIKYPWDLFSIVEELLENKKQQISDNASIADSAKIEGTVIIEKGAKVFENAVIKGPAYIGENVEVGNNALIRDHVSLEKNCTAGANTEIKNAVMQPGSSIHSGFIGDSVIGRDTHIGAETVTANRNFRKKGVRPEIITKLIGRENEEKNTGRTFLGAFIGDNVDIGVNVSIMPGVQIGSNANIGPGTVLDNNVNSGETVYVEQDQVRNGGQ